MDFRYIVSKGLKIPKKLSYRFILLALINFSKVGWTVPVKNENAQTLTNFFEKILKSSKAIFTMIAVLKYTGARLNNITDGELKFF